MRQAGIGMCPQSNWIVQTVPYPVGIITANTFSKLAFAFATMLRRPRTPHLFKKLFGQNEPHTFRRTAMTRILAVIHKVISIIEGQLFALAYVAPGKKPNPAPIDFSFAVRRATVVDETGRVPAHIPIKVRFIIQGKDVFVILFATPQRLLLVDPFTRVFQDACAPREVSFRKATNPVNGRGPKNNQLRFHYWVLSSHAIKAVYIRTNHGVKHRCPEPATFNHFV